MTARFDELDDSVAETWPLSQQEMVVAKFMLERLVEKQPESPLTADRKFVLENWPHVRPIY